MRDKLDYATSVLASLVRAGSGRVITQIGARPAHRLVLFDVESCPRSRLVREALSMLDLDVEIRPCPRGAAKHRAELRRLAGRLHVPFLLDPNTGDMLYSAERSVRYLFRTYGHGRVPLRLECGPLPECSSGLASALRGFRAQRIRTPVPAPEQLVELWGFENSAACRLVREELARLGMAYVLRNVAHGSPKLLQLWSRTGTERVPYLIDANTEVELADAPAIVQYLRSTYAPLAARLDGPGRRIEFLAPKPLEPRAPQSLQ